jgi:hypothetical protein
MTAMAEKLKDMKVVDLRVELKARGLDTVGAKVLLIDRLIASFDNVVKPSQSADAAVVEGVDILQTPPLASNKPVRRTTRKSSGSSCSSSSVGQEGNTSLTVTTVVLESEKDALSAVSSKKRKNNDEPDLHDNEEDANQKKPRNELDSLQVKDECEFLSNKWLPIIIIINVHSVC